MTDTPSSTTTDTTDASPFADPLARAQGALRFFQALTAEVTRRLSGEFVMPQTEAVWARHQRDQMEIARTAALVSIAESLDVIAGALRPGYRVDVDDPAGNESGATTAATVVTPESPTQPRL